MSYQTAYTTRFRSLDNTLWEIAIAIDGFEGSPMEISLEGDEPCVIDWQETGKTDVVQSSTCTLRVSNEQDRQMVQLMSRTNAFVVVSRNGKVYWRGTLDDAVYEEPYSFTTAYVTEITFSDFGVLNRIPFDLHGKQSVGAVVRYCLASAGLGFDDGYAVSLYTSLLDPGTLQPVTLDMLHINADRFASDGDEPTRMRQVLEEALRPLGLRVMQKNGQIYIYDIDYLRDYDHFHNYPVWKGTDASLKGSETYGNYDVDFEPDADETLADSGLDYDDTDPWTDSGTYFCKSYDEETGEDSDTGFYFEKNNYLPAAKLRKSANARFFRTRPVFTDSSDIGVAWRVKCKRLLGYYNNPLFGLLPIVADCVPVDNFTAPSLAATQEVFRMETGYLPLVPDREKYQLRVNLDFLLSFRGNPLDSPPDEWVAHQSWYYGGPSREKDWRAKNLFGEAVPVKLEVLDEQGNPVWHYVNAYIEDLEKDVYGNTVLVAIVHPRGIDQGLWREGPADSFSRMILSYYKDWDQEDEDRDPLVTSGWVGNRVSLSGKKQINGTLYRKRTDGEYLPLPPVAGRIRLTVGSGVFPIDNRGTEQVPYPCYFNFAWQLYRNPAITLVKANRTDDAIDTEAVNVRDHFNPQADHLGETLQAGTWQKGVAPSARGLLFDANGNVWEKFLKDGTEDTLSGHRLRSLIVQTRYVQPVISGTAELCSVFCAFKEWSTEGTFLAVAIRQDLHQDTEELTLARIGSIDDTGGIQPGFHWQAAWGNPLCTQEEARFAFLWTDPLCTQNADYTASWTNPLCTQRYQYDLIWEEVQEDT